MIYLALYLGLSTREHVIVWEKVSYEECHEAGKAWILANSNDTGYACVPEIQFTVPGKYPIYSRF